MQVASQKGQTIYHITKDNYSQILSQLKLSSHVMSDIRDAISAGREVTAHERNISVKGWTGLGYVILAPTTGAGAYLIDGGANGGLAFAVGAALGSLLALIVLPMAPVSVGVAVLFTPYILFAIAAITVLLYLFWDTIKDNEFARSCFLLGLGFGFGIRLGLGQLTLTMRSLIQFVAGIGVAFGAGWFTGVDKCLK